jgi:hypothetical protein
VVGGSAICHVRLWHPRPDLRAAAASLPFLMKTEHPEIWTVADTWGCLFLAAVFIAVVYGLSAL